MGKAKQKSIVEGDDNLIGFVSHSDICLIAHGEKDHAKITKNVNNEWETVGFVSRTKSEKMFTISYINENTKNEE